MLVALELQVSAHVGSVGLQDAILRRWRHFIEALLDQTPQDGPVDLLLAE